MFEEYNTHLELRIDWADLDLFGHVNNVAFFRFIQAARVNYCDQIGLSSLNETELSFMVASSRCDFKAPLHFPGEVKVYAKVDFIKNSSFQLSYLIVNNTREVCGEGSDVLVVFNHSKRQKEQISS